MMRSCQNPMSAPILYVPFVSHFRSGFTFRGFTKVTAEMPFQGTVPLGMNIYSEL